jgi:dCTP deaminase
MVLSDVDLRLRGPESVKPFNTNHVQPASIDLTLDDVFLIPKRLDYQWSAPIDLRDIRGVEYIRYRNTQFKIKAKEFILASTAERVEIPADLVGSIEGRSSLGRLGLFVHVTAGFIDPGFCGKITLEIYNVNEQDIVLHSGLRICQLALTQLTQPATRPYGSEGLGSHYQDQQETTQSRYDG